MRIRKREKFASHINIKLVDIGEGRDRLWYMSGYKNKIVKIDTHNPSEKFYTMSDIPLLIAYEDKGRRKV